MSIHVFLALIEELQSLRKLTDSKHVSLKEQVAIFCTCVLLACQSSTLANDFNIQMKQFQCNFFVIKMSLELINMIATSAQSLMHSHLGLSTTNMFGFQTFRIPHQITFARTQNSVHGLTWQLDRWMGHI